MADDEAEGARLGKAAEQAEEKRDHVVFIENFFDELRRIAPATKP